MHDCTVPFDADFACSDDAAAAPPVDEELNASDTELPFACTDLEDECDECIGAFHGAVQ